MRYTAFFRLMRLHQPVGIWLLLWPCWWSVSMASGGSPPLSLLALFAAGAVFMRSAGCIINDICDREFDRQVERTRNRPLASGEVSVAQAIMLLGILLALALLVAIALGQAVMVWAILSLPLVAAYPLMKRVSWWPQLFLGLTFNWGALMGWAAVGGTVQWPAFALYLGGMFWTLGYDTIYAHQDMIDDAKIGVKSSALRLGNHTKTAVTIFYALAVLCWAFAGYGAGAGLWFYAALLFVQFHLFWQVIHVRLNSPDSCKSVFKSNIWLGAILFVGTLIY